MRVSFAGPMRRRPAVRYVRAVNWLERQLERLRSFNPLAVDGVLAVVFTVVGIATVVRPGHPRRRGVQASPRALLVVTAVVICAPIAIRRRWPLMALVISAIGILVHLLVGWPEGSLPLAVLLLTFTVGAWCPLRRAVVGLAVVCATIVVLAARRRPDARHGRRVRRPRQVRRRVGARGRLPQSPRGERRQGARGRRASRGRAPERGQGAGRGAAAHRPGAARRRRPLDVRHRRPGRGRRARARRPAGAGAGRARGDLRHVAGHAHRDAPPARRAARQRRRPIVTPRLPVSPTCHGSSTTCAPPACRRRCTSRAPPTASTPASSCPPTGSCRRR